MEKLLQLVAARGGGEGVQMELTTRSGRRVGCTCSGQQRQDARGTWQRGYPADDGWQTRGVRFLNVVSYCSSHSDDLNRLTA